MEKETILVVDDYELNVEAIKIVLLDDFNIISANNGEDGLRKFKENQQIKLVITDYKMPVMNGLDLMRQIKKAKPGIPVIIMSGKIEVEELAINGGADTFLEKPINGELLITVVNRELREN